MQVAQLRPPTQGPCLASHLHSASSAHQLHNMAHGGTRRNGAHRQQHLLSSKTVSCWTEATRSTSDKGARGFVYLHSACFAHHLYNLAHRGAPHNGVVHQQHLLSLKHCRHGIQLPPHTHLPRAACNKGMSDNFHSSLPQLLILINRASGSCQQSLQMHVPGTAVRRRVIYALA